MNGRPKKEWKRFNAKLGLEVNEMLTKLAEQTGESKTAVVEKAIEMLYNNYNSLEAS